MLSLSTRPSAGRCPRARSAVPSRPVNTSSRSCSSTSYHLLRRCKARRQLLPLPALPGDASMGGRSEEDNPADVRVPSGQAESASSLTGTTPGGPANVLADDTYESSDTNPDMDPEESPKYLQREEQDPSWLSESGGSGSSGSSQQNLDATAKPMSEGFNKQWGSTRDVSDMEQGGSGGGGMQSPSKGAESASALTGKQPGGPQDLMADKDIESSDTNPAMDPSEGPTYTRREEQGSSDLSGTTGSSSSSSSSGERTSASDATPMSTSPHDPSAFGASGESGRDISDMTEGGSGGGGGGSSERAHPVARTAGTAIGSAAGTVLGAVAGPAGAAAGAALGGATGRKIVDALTGDRGQAEVYDQGAEPEQVAEDVMAARDAAADRLAGVGDAAADLAEDIRGRARKAQAAADDLVSRASERVQGSTGKYTGGPGSSTTGADREGSSLHKDWERAQAALDSDRTDRGADRGAGGEGKSHRGVTGAVKDAARSAATKVSDAADSIPFPTYPPAVGEEEDFLAAGGGTTMGGPLGDEAPEKLQAAADAVKDRARSAAEAVREGVRSAADKAGTLGHQTSERLQGAAGAAREVGADTARTAADYGSPETSERLQEMTNQGAAAGASSGGREADSGDWNNYMAQEDWGGGALQDAEAAVKADVGSPAAAAGGGGDSSLMQQDGMDLGSAISGTGAAAAAGGYGGGFGAEGSAEGSGAGFSADAGRAGFGTGGGATGVAAVDEGLPEGALAAGGVDAHAAMGVGNEATGEATSDSTAERVAQIYGVGPEASPGVDEANMYRAEAGQASGAPGEGAGSRGSSQGTAGGASGVNAEDEAAKLAAFVEDREGDDEAGLGNVPERNV